MTRFLSLASLLVASLAFATPPTGEAPSATQTLVEEQLLKPLAAREKKQSRFSRSRQPAQARRVRVVEPQPVKDDAGQAFVTFAVDARHGLDLEDGANDRWRKDTIVGCAYLQSGEVFVKRGDGYYPAAVLAGKKSKVAAAHVCRTDAGQIALMP